MGNSQTKEDEQVNFSGEIDLRHFELLRICGRGAFGKVRIVEKKDTKKQYALKYINKQQCLRMAAVQNVFRERRILEELNHPFICNLRYAFQDDENMFLVIDLMLGGDLRFHIEHQKGIPESALVIIGAEIASGLKYLHKIGIVHRDIKPENILLDEHGHASITDFNIAVHYSEDKPLKSQSGTTLYMAPEMFCKPYTYTVDWWSFGIVLFECIFGTRPFQGESTEDTIKSILNDPLVFPVAIKKKKIKEGLLSQSGEQLIFELLQKDPKKRLGCKEGFDEIQEHPWFVLIDWVLLDKKQMKCLFIPDLSKPNFEAAHDLEELLLDDNPLQYKPRKQKIQTEQTVSPAVSASSLISMNSSRHPGDYDPYLTALQKGEMPGKKGVKISSKTRKQLELEYIETQFKNFDYEMQFLFKPLLGISQSHSFSHRTKPKIDITKSPSMPAISHQSNKEQANQGANRERKGSTIKQALNLFKRD